MNWKNILLLTGFALPFSEAFGQYTADALRFSQTEQGLTARFRAMGGAQTALGGDLSSLASNPAGLGLFTRNEISLTADLSNTNAATQYLGNGMNVQKDKLGLNQFGAVFHLSPPRRIGSDLSTGWVGFNFGIGYNKTSNYSADVSYGGSNESSSFVDYVADLASVYNGLTLPQGSLEKMAYSSFLIDLDSKGYFSTAAVQKGGPGVSPISNSQLNSTFYTGSQSEVNISGGANYSNQLYVGASISLNTIRFGADREFTESGKTVAYTGQLPDFAGASYRLAYRSNQNTDGSGINLKAGFIYRPIPSLRLGVSAVSPTWYTFDDVFSEGLTTRYSRANGSQIPAYTNADEVYNSKYSLRTPYHVNGGASLIIGGAGLITADVEYVDYSSMRFSSDDQVTEDNMNRDFARKFQSATNFRVGGELKLNSMVMIRGGFNTSGNPYQDASYSSKVVSGGLGYRKNNFFTDLTYAQSAVKYTAMPYLITTDYDYYTFTGPGETASINEKRNNFYLTFGVRF